MVCLELFTNRNRKGNRQVLVAIVESLFLDDFKIEVVGVSASFVCETCFDDEDSYNLFVKSCETFYGCYLLSVSKLKSGKYTGEYLVKQRNIIKSEKVKSDE